MGHGGHDTASPEQALRWLAEGQTYDLAILDMHMPEMDGATLAAKIREQATSCRWCCSPRWAGAKTATGLFAASLAKPLRQSQLFDTLVSLLAPDTATPREAPAKPSSTPRWPRATRCASCWPKTTW